MGECQITMIDKITKITMSRKTKLLIKQANQAIQLVIIEKTPSLNHINLHNM